MRKIRNLKNKKINSKKIIGLTSLILAGSLLTACNTDFARKEHEYRRIEFTSNGEYTEESQFEPYDSNNKKNLPSSFIYYGKWVETEDGNYSRIVEEYDASNITYEVIRQLRDNKDVVLDDVLGEPTEIYEQIIDNVSKEELESGAYFKAIIYFENEDKYVTVKNKKAVNPAWLIVTGLGSFTGIGALIAWNNHDEKEKKKLTLEKREK